MDGTIWWMSTIFIVLAILVLLGSLFKREMANYGRYYEADKRPLLGILVPGSIAWMFQELPAFLVPLILILSGFEAKCDNIANKIMIGLFVLHYFHRSAIYPFLMKAPKPSPFELFASAFLFCSLNGFLQGWYFVKVAAYPADWVLEPNFVIGTVVFFLGMMVNVHSDGILRNLRNPGETEYKIPKGGLFELVSGANYLGEIIEWWGLAIASMSYPATAFAVFTTTFVGSRALRHHKLLLYLFCFHECQYFIHSLVNRYYLEKFKNYPKTRKAVIPFVF